MVDHRDQFRETSKKFQVNFLVDHWAGKSKQKKKFPTVYKKLEDHWDETTKKIKKVPMVLQKSPKTIGTKNKKNSKRSRWSTMTGQQLVLGTAFILRNQTQRLWCCSSRKEIKIIQQKTLHTIEYTTASLILYFGYEAGAIWFFSLVSLPANPNNTVRATKTIGTKHQKKSKSYSQSCRNRRRPLGRNIERTQKVTNKPKIIGTKNKKYSKSSQWSTVVREPTYRK